MRWLNIPREGCLASCFFLLRSWDLRRVLLFVEEARAVSAVEKSSILDVRLGFVRGMCTPEENEHRKKYNANYSLIIIYGSSLV